MPEWRRTFCVVWITQFIAVLGFSFVMPFMPYYVQELGITDPKEVAWWAGLVTSAHAISMALLAPVWGVLADRYGRKPMVQRASFAGAFVLSLMAFVTSVQQLVALRFLQGALTGVTTATTTLVAGLAPKEQAGRVLGTLQTAQFLGVSLGPLVGGVVGDSLGFRTSFYVTGVLLLFSGLLVTRLVHEDFRPSEVAPSPSSTAFGKNLSVLTASGCLVALFAARLAMRTGARVLGPVLPLFVQTLLPAGARVATVTGLIAAFAALGSSLGSPLIGRWGDRVGHRPMLVGSALLAAFCFVPQSLANGPWTLLFWQSVGGFALGGTISTMTALLSAAAPAGRQGVIFGLDASVVAAANGIAPLAGAAAAAGLGLRAPFLVSAVMLLLGAFIASVWVRGEGTTASVAQRTARNSQQPQAPQ